MWFCESGTTPEKVEKGSSGISIAELRHSFANYHQVPDCVDNNALVSAYPTSAPRTGTIQEACDSLSRRHEEHTTVRGSIRYALPGRSAKWMVGNVSIKAVFWRIRVLVLRPW